MSFRDRAVCSVGFRFRFFWTCTLQGLQGLYLNPPEVGKVMAVQGLKKGICRVEGFGALNPHP